MMIYQLLPESPKSGSSASNPCRLVGLKYVSSLIIAVIASVMLYVAFGVSTSELGRTGTGFFDDTTAKDVSAGPVMDRADFGGESKYVERNFEPVERIALLGERHSGTNWITDHLQECFGRVIEVTPHYTRFKHWFQKEELYTGSPKSVVVVAMFRDPYDWVWAMKERPHHAHDHIGLPWLEFVTKPWIGKRGTADKNITLSGMKNNVTCFSSFSFVEIMPCSREDSPKVVGHADYKYELFHDGSERAYPSIIDLRREKIKNHLSASRFNATRAFGAFHYEDLESNGTEQLLSFLEEATGINRKCKAQPKGSTHKKDVPKEYVTWMTKYVDWDMEAQIGYLPRQT